MPQYKYKCTQCKKGFFIFSSFSDFDEKITPNRECVFCKGDAKRKFLLPKIMHKYGKHTMSIKRVEQAKDFARKNAADLVQPTIYDKQKKEFVDNPDYVRHHGDYKKNNIVKHGSGNQELLDSGVVDVEFKGGDDE